MISVQFRKILTFVITLVLAAGTTAPAYAQAVTITQRFVEPIDGASAIACNGEEVIVTGELHITFQTTVDAAGGIHERFTLVPHNVRGVGSVTGTQYKAVGGNHWHVFTGDADFAPFNFTQAEMFNLVSQGGSDNLQLKFTFHGTVNANGVETVFFDRASAQCLG
ncbi:MAG TPA: hypothetical protein VFY26_02980 [Anaerolineales bacterium]|nr:hypothetical protein [Anaerolineales bacterium]